MQETFSQPLCCNRTWDKCSSSSSRWETHQYQKLLFVLNLVNKSIVFCCKDLYIAVWGRVRMGLCPPFPYTSSGQQVTWLINVNRENLFRLTLDRFDWVWISKVKMSFLGCPGSLTSDRIPGVMSPKAAAQSYWEEVVKNAANPENPSLITGICRCAQITLIKPICQINAHSKTLLTFKHH